LLLVGGEDIYNGNLKLILGLVWRLILRYQMSIERATGVSGSKRGVSAKKVLLGWVQSAIPQINVGNFTSHWRDGVALTALLDSLQPGLAPNYGSLNKNQMLVNVTSAMQLAEKEFAVPQIIRPEDLVNPEIDELSVMTYLSYFCGAGSPGFHNLLKWVNSVIPEYKITNFTSDWRDGRALSALVNALSPGLIPNHYHLNPSQALENVQKAMDLGENKLRVKPTLTAEEFIDPHLDQVSMMSYLTWFRWAVPTQSEAEKVKVSGAGVTGGLLNTETEFVIKYGDAVAPSKISATVHDPHGRPVPVKMHDLGNGNIIARYMPVVPGIYTVRALCGEEEISGSPFRPKFDMPPQASACKAYGEGLSDAVVHQPATFVFQAGKEAGNGELHIAITDPSGQPVEVSQKVNGDETCVNYIPTEAGSYGVMLKWSGEDVPGGPFRVKVINPSQCVCVGEGLKEATVGEAAQFAVKTDGAGPGVLTATAYGPKSSVPVEIVRDSEGVYKAEYTPTELGDYTLDIKWSGYPVANSPYTVKCFSNVDPSKVKVIKPKTTTRSGRYALGRPIVYRVNSEQAGKGELTASAMNRLTGKAVPITISQEKEGQFNVGLSPTETGEYSVDFRYDDIPVSTTPYQLAVVESPNAKKVKIKPGPQGQEAVMGTEAIFYVDASEAGDGKLTASAYGLSPTAKPQADVTSHGKGQYTVAMTTDEPGDSFLQLFWDDTSVDGTPVNVRFIEPPDPSKVKVNSSSLPRKLLLGSPFRFDVDTSRAGTGRLTAQAVKKRTGEKKSVAVKDVGFGRQAVHFDPNTADDYEVALFWDGEPVSVPPVEVKYLDPPDASKVRLKTPAEAYKEATVGQSRAFVFDTALAGTGKLSAYAHSEEHGPVDVQVEEVKDFPGEYKVTFTPRHPDEYQLNTFWDGIPVPGSPILIKALPQTDASRVKTLSIAPKRAVMIGETARVTFDTADAGRGELTALAVGEKSGPLPVEVVERGGRIYEVKFTPEHADKYSLNVEWDNESISGAPFRFKFEAPQNEGDPSKVKVSSISPPTDQFRVGQMAEIVLDASAAGDGVPTAQIMGARTGPVTSEVMDTGNGQYVVVFTPDKPDRYQVELFWDNEEIKESPINMKCLPRKSDLSKIKVSDLDPAVVLQPVKFYVNANDAGDGELLVRARGPTNGEPPEFNVESTGDGLYEAYYVPNAAGHHKFEVSWSGEPIPGSPFFVNVMGNSDAGKVIVNGPGVEKSQHEIGQAMELDVDASRAPRGKLTAHAVGTKDYMPQHVEIANLGGQQYAVRFTPNDPDTYMVCVKYNGENVLGSPFKAKFIQPPDASLVEVQGLRNGVIYEPISFKVDARQAGAGELLVRAAGPTTGGTADFDLKNVGAGLFTATYIPTASGEHLFHVTWSNVHIPGSPFKVNVSSTEGRARSVEVSELPDAKVETGTPVDLVVNTSKAGEGKLTGTCRGLHVGTVQVQVLRDKRSGTTTVRFVPPLPDDYVLDVLWDGRHIPDSPFTVHAFSPAKRLSSVGTTATYCSVLEPRLNPDDPFLPIGQPVRYIVQTPGVPTRHLSAIASGPKGTCPVTIQNIGNGAFMVEIVPSHSGNYRLVCKVFDTPVPKSPFTFMVGRPHYDATKVIVSGRGFADKDVSFPVGTAATLDVDARNAGTGRLLVDASGPISDNSELQVTDNGDGTYGVKLQPVRPGNFQLDVTWVDKPVAGSPFSIRFYRGSVSDPKKIFVEGPGLCGAPVNAAGEFSIFGADGDPENLEVTCQGVKAKAQVFVDSINAKEGVFHGHYLAPVAGAYLLCIKWGGEHVSGSPFKITVGQAGISGQVKVLDVPQEGIVGKLVEFLLDARSAGRGQLTMKVQGPGNPQTNVDSGRPGAVLASFFPTETGKYSVSLKWLGKHVQGSPFKVRVASPPRPEKVLCYGAGLEGGVVGSRGVFIVDTKSAGGGVLAVRVHGPKGAFKIHMEKSPEDDRLIVVSYNPTEAGRYRMDIKWSDADVPGSPFSVQIQPKGISV
jgi:filamin